jgi:hypothetical protein
MASPSNIPTVQIVGEFTHPDFRDALERLRCEARLTEFGKLPPELIVVARSRPDAIRSEPIDALRRAAPLAGVVTLLGSWCEGETRTGRPWPGEHRLYWYEFPAWWERQMSLRAAGRCPDWARPVNFGFRISDCGLANGEPGRSDPRSGLIVVQTLLRDTAEALADVFHGAGYATVWQQTGRPRPIIQGAVAGVWDGAQFNDCEAADLTRFRTQLSYHGAPVIALLDFPRRDRLDRALQLGAAAVLGKPWLRSDLTSTLKASIVKSRRTLAA